MQSGVVNVQMGTRLFIEGKILCYAKLCDELLIWSKPSGKTVFFQFFSAK